MSLKRFYPCQLLLFLNCISMLTFNVLSSSLNKLSKLIHVLWSYCIVMCRHLEVHVVFHFLKKKKFCTKKTCMSYTYMYTSFVLFVLFASHFVCLSGATFSFLNTFWFYGNVIVYRNIYCQRLNILTLTPVKYLKKHFLYLILLYQTNYARVPVQHTSEPMTQSSEDGKGCIGTLITTLKDIIEILTVSDTLQLYGE